ncbi:MAG: hypothetical protein ACO1PM_08170 [Acidovorax sp.]
MSEQAVKEATPMDALVEQRLNIIRRNMPEVLAVIGEKAKRHGPVVYALVRRGLRGEPGCFYAFERGHVVGAAFGKTDPRMVGAAQFLVEFGCAHVCIWPDPMPGGDGGPAHGTD